VTAPDAPAVSVILPCLDAAKTICVQLEALARQEWAKPWELVVSDGGSTDGTLEILDRYRERLPLRIVDSSDRRGNAHGRNVGAGAARAPALVFCDADDRVGDGWLAAVGEGLERHDFVSSRVDVTALNPPWLRSHRPHTGGSELPRVPFPPHMLYAGTCSLGIRKTLYEALGGFDESLHIADDDLSIRVQLAGNELILLRDAVVHVRHRDRWLDIFHQARSYARDWALFQKRYADPTLHVSVLRWLLHGWRWIVRATPWIRTPEGRSRLAWVLGWQVGRYEGSIEHRVLSIS
jgi:glycosyltransferase involved in cell wall biosynthesis